MIILQTTEIKELVRNHFPHIHIPLNNHQKQIQLILIPSRTTPNNHRLLLYHSSRRIHTPNFPLLPLTLLLRHRSSIMEKRGDTIRVKLDFLNNSLRCLYGFEACLRRVLPDRENWMRVVCGCDGYIAEHSGWLRRM